MKSIHEYVAQAKQSFFGEEAPLEFFVRRKNIIVGAAAVWIIASGGYYAVSTLSDNPQQDAQKEAAALIAQVGKLILLPDNEEPVIATVNDPEQLKDQPFFINAKEGDKVLIYNTSRKAILYSPTDNRIVEVAPLNPSAAQ